MAKIKYDFDTVVSRRNTGSLKWNVEENDLPMWVADMDFKTAPEIIDAISNRVSHGIFGYSDMTDEWYEAYINWWKNRHGFEMEKDWLVFCTGVVPAISSTVRKLTSPNENVVIQTPVYNIFFNSIVNNGCRVLTNPLKYIDGAYEMDFEDLEQKLSNPQTSLMILCNPHNPAGKIWDKETLKKVGDLCVKYGVTVISDEIHCDIVRPGTEYVPFASVSDNCKNCSITCIASTKAFNIAGMQSAAVSIPNKFLRHKIWRALNTDEVAEPNAFAVTATIAAFTKGEEWLNQLNEYLFENRSIVEDYIEKNIQDLNVVKADATYLVWIDISKLGINSE
ncbi:MAG: pyridoxal phosphate-dependent aminotransferase, partial [Clostridia bacterium]|nr:pyridoxal phosphate-dependent aminotransferase [Clostridia bacterium]